jgi:hypothetical protein
MTDMGKDGFPRSKVAAAVVLVLGALGATSAQAFKIDTGNSDVDMRWDNTVRYNAGWRVTGVDQAFYRNPNTDETEGTFDKGDMVTNRLDLFSEFDFSYQGNYGFRVSAGLWSENAYDDKPKGNPAFAYSNYNDGQGSYSPYAKRYLTGSSGEIMDAFMFGGFNLGDTSLKFKAGQHNQYWGESLYSLGDSIAHAQGPVDTIKAATSPGAEAKELFMPLNQISGQWQLSSELSLMGQYLLDWKKYRLVPGSTYFAVGNTTDGYSASCAQVDPTGNACQAVFLEDITPERHHGGDYGIAARWSPAWLDGTMGFYYRKYDEKNPWFATQFTGLATPAGIRLVYGRDTELYGWSLTKTLAGISVGTEVSYRKNTMLNSVAGYFIGSQGVPFAGFTNLGGGVVVPTWLLTPGSAIPATTTPTIAQADGAHGNTWHFLVNGVYLLPKTALWDGGTIQGELTYQRLDKVTKNADIHYSVDYACKTGYLYQGILPNSRNQGDGCATRDAWGLAMGFTPEWPQAFAGWDLALPISYRTGLKGNSPAIAGPNEGSYVYSIGLRGKYHAVHEFTLAYNGSYTQYKTNAAGVYNGVPNGSGAIQSNHDWLSFTYKTSF